MTAFDELLARWSSARYGRLPATFMATSSVEFPPPGRDRGTCSPAGGLAPPARPASSLPTAYLACVAERTFTKLYTSLTALNIHTAIRVRPQFNPECRVSKAHRNILHCRFAERKVIFAEIWRWLLKLDSKNYISIAALLSPGIQSGRAENVRIERHALLEDISIGGTG